MIELTIPQTDFVLSDAKYPLFVAGFGAGKSTCLAVNLLSDLGYFGANVAAYAPTYDLLDLILVPYLEEHLENNHIPYKFQKQKHIINVEGYGDIILRSLDTPARIVGYQVFRSHIDELDTLPKAKAKEAWEKIIARNRQKVFVYGPNNRKIKVGEKDGAIIYQTYLNRVSAYTTPEGFNFCYERWEKNKTKSYKLYRASTRSNPHLPEDYIDTLMETYPAQLIEAYIEGLFVNLTSGSVYPKFNRIENGSSEYATDREELHVGMDFNVLKGSAVIHVIRNGNPHAVDEIHNAYDTDEQIEILKTRYPKNRIIIYPDASGNHMSSSNTSATDLQKLMNAGFEVIVNYSNPSIKDRVNNVNAMICNGKGLRRYFINTETCPETVACIEQQIWGSNGLPDKSGGLDHKPDAIGYFISQMFPIQRIESSTHRVRGSA